MKNMPLPRSPHHAELDVCIFLHPTTYSMPCLSRRSTFSYKDLLFATGHTRAPISPDKVSLFLVGS